MKRLATLLLFAMLRTSFSYAKSEAVEIGPLPPVQNASPMLRKSLHALRMRVEADAKDCLDAAKGMESLGKYNATLKKVIDVNKVVILEVSGTMICDGIHSSSYQYAVALEKETGRRLDLNLIYNIATRQDDRLFLRPELVDAARTSYRQANKNNRACLDETDWEVELANLPITFSPLQDGSMILYYASSDVSAACFPALRLAPGAFSKFRDASRASQYRLP
ncbi:MULTISPECIES: hypothetical protein [Caballeronia]|jgi:hypothetical protein|uniref:hypothetical protein n=1 Tax=Caballeronia TaxID=1827195 RepID=UPI00025BC7BC|nr:MULTISPECIES: hypothetical protein [Caballeronia]EKS71217.1 hypothetical protein BURK_014903 [Burkholderia sp. SJ98]